MHENLIRDAQNLRGRLGRWKTKTGRRRYPVDEDEDVLAPQDPFLWDEIKLLNAKRFRSLEHMTQVATLPMNSNIRNRKTHTMEVVACAITISDLLGLNTNLVIAIALGHDIGHVPFGHQGEAWMKKTMGRPEFCHEVMGPIIAQKIERKGRGLNLTHETLEGMLRHSGKTEIEKMSAEACVVRYADKIAYIFADYNDIKRMGCWIPSSIDIAMKGFGSTQRERTAAAIAGLVVESVECRHVSFKVSPIAQQFEELRKMMYGVYPRVTEQNPCDTLEPVFEYLAQLKIADPFLLLALMTDRDVINLADVRMKNVTCLQPMAIHEMFGHLDKIGKVDLCDPDLDW